MSDQVILNLIRNSTSLLTLIKGNGEIVFSSNAFDSFIADRLPYESNLLEILLHADEINKELLTMFDNKRVLCEKFPIKLKINNKDSIEISCVSNLTVNKQQLILIEFFRNLNHFDNFVKEYIESVNLFRKNKKALLVYSEEDNKIISINNKGENLINCNNLENNKARKLFLRSINEIVENAKIGGTTTRKVKIKTDISEISINFECNKIKKGYYLISFNDCTNNDRENEIASFDKQRAQNIISVVPGILFEFEITNNKLKFTYISEKIRDLIGLSASHIQNDSSKLFKLLPKHERARLHYFFSKLTEHQRKTRNEFKINSLNNGEKWVTVNWLETQSILGIVKGIGYIDDITEKKQIEIEKRETANRKKLKEFFTISLLKQPSVHLLLQDLAKNIVLKLNLQDIVIYIYNSDTKKLEIATSYFSEKSTKYKYSFPKVITSNKGIISRVVKSLNSVIINQSSKDKDFFYINSPSKSEITIPILFEGELLGIIDSQHQKQNFFTHKHLIFLEDIAETLAKRLIQKKRQEHNFKFKTTLKRLYENGKIFVFKFNVKTKTLNDTCIDRFINLIEITDTTQKIKIYNNPKILRNYVLRYDLDTLTNFEKKIEESIIKAKEITFRIITETGYIKWLKVIVSEISRNKNKDIESIIGTVQDISLIKKLESKDQ
jgi:PAS domain S-box-containing protein